MDKPNAGTELLTGYSWVVNRVAENAIILSLSHPRHGELRYLVLPEEVGAWIGQLQSALAAKKLSDMPPPH